MKTRLTGLLVALVFAGCGSPAAMSSNAPTATPSEASSPTPSPQAVEQSPTTASCIIHVPSRFVDDSTPFVIETEGVTPAECAAVVESDNSNDDFGKSHPEVILSVAPSEPPLCSHVVFWRFGNRMARMTVWGDGLAGQNYCFTLEFMASHTPPPSN